MALSLDGNAHSNQTSNSGTVTLTTTGAGMVGVIITTNGGPVLSVTASGLTFTFRISGPASGTNVCELWWAPSSGALSSKVITVTTTSSAFLTIDAFGVGGSDTTTKFDANASFPGFSDTDGLAAVNTSNADDFIVAGFRLAGSASGTAGVGYTLINSGDFQTVEYKIVSSTQTGLAVNQSEIGNGSVVDAIIRGAAPTNPSILFLRR